MARKIRFKKATLESSANWKKGILKRDAPKDIKKQVCCVSFYDEDGNEYVWSPLKGETNDVLDVARQMILAEEMNFPYIKNPEPRKDIQDLKLVSRFLEDKV